MANKYNFDGIGRAGALLMFSGIAASPFAWLTQGILGKITFWILTQITKFFASQGLILLNVGVANVQTLMQKEAYDGAFAKAFRAIAEKGDRLTPAEKQAIDADVIAAFDNFADFGVR